MNKFIKILFIIFCFFLQSYVLTCNNYNGVKDSILKHKFSAEINAIYPYYFLNNKYSNYRSNFNWGLGIGFSIDLFKGPNFNIGLSYTTKNYYNQINSYYFDIVKYRISFYNLSLLTTINLSHNLSIRLGVFFIIPKSYKEYTTYNNPLPIPPANPYIYNGLTIGISLPYIIKYNIKLFDNLNLVLSNTSIYKISSDDKFIRYGGSKTKLSLTLNFGVEYFVNKNVK